MNESTVGNCLHLYLDNYALLWSLEEHESLPDELKEEEQLISSFRQRSSDQASTLLEDLYSRLLGTTALPYRIQRRSQRRTVREQWQMNGSFLRPREKMARNFWSLCLGYVRGKGPSACLILGPNEPDNPAVFEALAKQVASTLELESANARTCFNYDSGYEGGLLVGLSTLVPSSTYESIAKSIKDGLGLFLNKHRAQFEQSLDGA